MKPFSFIFLYFALLLAIGAGSCNVKEKDNEDRIHLKLKLKSGDIYSYSFQQTQDIQGIGNTDLHQTMNIGMFYQKVDTLSDIHQVKVTFSHIKIKNNSPIGQLDYNSNNPDSNSLLKSIGNVVGQTYFINFNDAGSLNKVINPPPIERNLTEDDLAKIINDSTFSILLRNHFGLYPGKGLKVNDEWSRKINIMLFNYDIIQESTFRLQKIENGVATISSVGTLKVPKIKEEQTENNFKIKMEGQQNGSIKIDLESGIVLSFQSQLTLNGTISMMGQSFPLKIKGETKAVSRKIN